ncbi:MAG: hypothetical protein CYPHOPRED_005257 [Cyphobasidiales sp. Tagirdzhanova-0007]|nr:MAG: hypothetical protein CYPHOPRED_005257 [Cyphobasidiales sp. Tagirdzhanova-0007]
MNQSIAEPDYLACSVILTAPLRHLRSDLTRPPILSYRHILDGNTSKKQPMAALYRQHQYAAEDLAVNDILSLEAADSHHARRHGKQAEEMVEEAIWDTPDSPSQLQLAGPGANLVPDEDDKILEAFDPSLLPPPPTWLSACILSNLNSRPKRMDDISLLRWLRRHRLSIMRASMLRTNPIIQPPPLKQTKGDFTNADSLQSPQRPLLRAVYIEGLDSRTEVNALEPGHDIWTQIMEEAVMTTTDAAQMRPDVMDSLWELLANAAMARLNKQRTRPVD